MSLHQIEGTLPGLEQRPPHLSPVLNGLNGLNGMHSSSPRLEGEIGDHAGIPRSLPQLPLGPVDSPRSSSEQTDNSPTPLDFTEPRLLSYYNQAAPRDYVAFGLCFPHRTSRAEDIEGITAHLQESLLRLASTRPEYTGHLARDSTKAGWLKWVPAPLPVPATGIRFSFRDIRRGLNPFQYTYAEFEAAGFPPALFKHEKFRLGWNANPADPTQASPTADTVPVAVVRAFFIDGGVILNVLLHHSFGDGKGMGMFISCLAAATRGNEVPPHPPRWSMDEPECILRRAKGLPPASVAELAKRCAEHAYVPGKNVGPTQPVFDAMKGKPMAGIPTAAKIFVFGPEKLDQLRELLQRRPEERLIGRTGPMAETDELPSRYAALAALTWAHVTHARMATEGFHSTASSSSSDPPQCMGEVATLWNPMDWRPRIMRAEPSCAEEIDDYCGNATLKCLTTVPTGLLFEAAQPPPPPSPSAGSTPSISDADATAKADAEAAARLRSVAAHIMSSHAAIDQDWVALRTRVNMDIPDPRNLGMNMDPRVPQDQHFNTWFPFGADEEFRIGPGGREAVRPDAIRKMFLKDSIDFLNLLIMPGRKDSGVVELLVCMPCVSLEALCSDQRWLKWVDRVIG